MGDVRVGHDPVQVVPEHGYVVEVANKGGTVWYGPVRELDPSTVTGSLDHDETLSFDEPLWFMCGSDARLIVAQRRVCPHCGGAL